MVEDVIYPFYTEVALYTLDPYWKQLFENCSCGKFPKKVFTRNGKLLYITTKKGKETVTVPDDPLEAYKFLSGVFHNKLNLYSKLELLEKNDRIFAMDFLETNYEKWTKIRNKGIKDYLLSRYVKRKCMEHNITDIVLVYNSIYLAILFKWIDSSDIKLVDGDIESIDNIRFLYNDVEIVRRNCKISKTVPKPKVVSLIDEFYKYQLSIFS